MKKFFVSFMGVLGVFSVMNAAELKCDSLEAKVAFAKAHEELSDSATKTLLTSGKFEEQYEDGFLSIWFDKGDLVVQAGGEEEGLTTTYSKFSVAKNNKTSLTCKVHWEAMESAGGGDGGDTTFAISKDSKGNLVVNIADWIF